MTAVPRRRRRRVRRHRRRVRLRRHQRTSQHDPMSLSDDLLMPGRELRVFSDKKMGLHVTDATAVEVKSAAEATALLVQGSANR